MILPVQMSFDRKTGREISRVEMDVPDEVFFGKLMNLMRICPLETTEKERKDEKEIHNR